MNPDRGDGEGLSGKPGARLVAEELDELVVAAIGREPGGATVPPPPILRAMTETSTEPSVERRLTLRASRWLSGLSRTTAATDVPSIPRTKSMMPSVRVSSAPVAA